jgi:hypothetical protein
MIRVIHTAVALAALLATGACSNIDVDRHAPGFDSAQYAHDLGSCGRGEGILDIVGMTFVGAFIGASEGVHWGALRGDSGDGAIIGTIVGAVLGFGVGAYEPATGKNTDVARSLRGMGYVISPDDQPPLRDDGEMS